ncbi:YfhO family protein [Enterococcus quebecensis]|uniref:Copper ABC transporter permease n=1 Tax=Enterococcus quebecensis TaxID=903983 RepID=A0A1E5GS63_9ENTE|nr:YfhO family protein [Enterococcus quebecensis]OEG15548.1 copper ABC transporter permease [Enterococcus quebecensis]
MNKKISLFFKENSLSMVACFFIPIVILAVVYAEKGIYPGSSISIMASDSFSQFSAFHASFNNMLHGKQNILYTWNASLGLNYCSFISYYLGGFLTPLVFFFDNQNIPDALYFLTLLKIGLAGLSFWFYGKHTFRLSKGQYVILSLCYGLMGFSIALSEMIMWLDAMYYLPLIILGINRLMDKGRPLLLFLSYFFLFITNFYMAFMIGLFSFFYFIVRWFSMNGKVKEIVHYLITSLLAGGASMVVVLPTLIDLRNNGESFSSITGFTTDNMGIIDLVAKNMVGVYDTTRNEGTPFIYVGLIPLILCLFFFFSKKINKRSKLSLGALFLLLIASFYIEPLNLFWMGMHTPNNLPFRYSFLFSFLVLITAGYGWEKLKIEDSKLLSNIMIGLIFVFSVVKIVMSRIDGAQYLKMSSFIITVLMLCVYFVIHIAFQKKQGKKWLFLLLLLSVTVELGLNTRGLIEGIKQDWTYPERNLYSGPYPEIKKLVDQTKHENDDFYRMENLNPVSKNDVFTYGYSGVTMFSSIRNRNSAAYLDSLGFRSWGTNLQIQYPNNTLMLDALVGIKYNLSLENPMKFGYKKVGESEHYSLYENDYALPLGVMTDRTIYNEGVAENQTNLFEQLSGRVSEYYDIDDLTSVEEENIVSVEEGPFVTYSKSTDEPSTGAMKLTWKAKIPAHKQAYLSLKPAEYRPENLNARALFTVDKVTRGTQISRTNQYYNIGNYEEETEVTFSIRFYNGNHLKFLKPDLVFLDTKEFAETIQIAQKNGVEFKNNGNALTAEVNVEQNNVLWTTIPYDKGWSAYVDGEKVKLKPFKDAFISLIVPQGKHKVKLVFIPEGLIIGAVLSVVCFIIFFCYLQINKKLKAKHQIEM